MDVFWPRPVLQASHGTVRKRAIFPQPSNQKQLKYEAIMLMSVNEALMSRYNFVSFG